MEFCLEQDIKREKFEDELYKRVCCLEEYYPEETFNNFLHLRRNGSISKNALNSLKLVVLHMVKIVKTSHFHCREEVRQFL